MYINAAIIEKLEINGTLKSTELKSSQKIGDLVVAFVDEYNEAHSGPFYFRNSEYENEYKMKMRKACARRVGAKFFTKSENKYIFITQWSGIPTKRQEISYYALILPENAIPLSISFKDPHSQSHQYKQSVRKDDTNKCFIIYLECKSSKGLFDFVLECAFEIDSARFYIANYTDSKTNSTDFHIDIPDKYNQKLKLKNLTANMKERTNMEEKKKVFISSACFNLKDLRAELAKEIESLGYKAMWNESPNFPVKQGIHSHDTCLDAVKECDIYVLIIDNRYGGLYAGDKYPKKDISITQYEAEIAIQQSKEIYTFVREEIWNERPTYKKNLKKGIEIELFHADNEKVYEFIEYMNNLRGTSNWICPFKTSVELKEILGAKLKKVERLRKIGESKSQSIDITYIKEINKIFSGNLMHAFFETLSESQAVYIEQIVEFEIAIKRHLAPDKMLRNEMIEKAKSNFLISLDKFIMFGSKVCYPLPNGIISKFYGGISEIDILKNSEAYDKNDKKFTRLVRDIYKKWNIFQMTIRSEMPEYKWE